MPDLTAEQKRVIKKALRVARQRGASPRVEKALVAAMAVESNYRHLDYGDRDSVGVLQQRPSQGWGPAGETVEKDVNDFLDRAIPANEKFKGSAGQLAQAVQRSAFPARYDVRGAEADAIRRMYGSGQSIRQSPKRSAGQSAGPQSMTVTEGAVDNSGLRRQLVGEFLGAGGVQNPNAVLALAGSYPKAQDVPGTPVTYETQQAPARSSPRRKPASSPRSSGSYAGTTGAVIDIARLAHGYGLETSSGKRDTVNTASGNVSDHYRGNKTANARDLTGSVQDMDKAAVAIAKRLGIKGYKKGQRLETSVTRDGVRYQVLYRTHTGGNHFNHIHVGAKRVET